MDKRKMGNLDTAIAPVIFGGNVFGWTIDEKRSFELLDRFVDMGFNAVDTADSYSHWAPGNSGGESETIIGNWLKTGKPREKLVVITKVGSNPGKSGHDISKDYIIKTAEESLRRLRTDYIDFYLTHWDDEKTPVEETLSAYQKLISDGKVRYVGASNLSPRRLNDSLKASFNTDLPCYQVLQPEYNLYDRAKFEKNYRDICLERNLGVTTYYSLASGFLTGKYRDESDLDKSKRGSGVKKYLDERGKRILRALDTVSEKHGVEPAAIALAWLLRQPAVTAPIASATKPSHLESFSQAAEVKLDPDDLKMLDER